MALYIPIARRRRNAALVAIATLLVGLGVGFVTGRSSAVTAHERSASVHSQADTLGTRLEALTIEYEQAVAGTGDSVQGGVLDALDIFEKDLDRLIAAAPWLGAAQIAALHSASSAVRAAAQSKVTVDKFTAVADTAAETVRTTFGADH